MARDQDRNIKLYYYWASPIARRLVWYLKLRGIPYCEVKQPMIMPRPDLKAIGVAYRRIPVMTIGKDIYCDTRLILEKLEELFPSGKLGAPTLEGQALQKLLEVWHFEGPLFFKGTYTMPLSVFKDPTFTKDRAQMTGYSWDAEIMSKRRPDALVYMRSAFGFFEKLLSDGRNWIVSTDEPTLADLEAIFVVHWLSRMEGALPGDLISKDIFPKTYAWMDRFDNALRMAQSKAPKPFKLDGATAAKQIFASDFAEQEGDVDPADPQKNIRKGDEVELFPTDSGSNNKDHGKLISLTEKEIVIKLENGLRLHTPRAGFKVRQINSKM